MNTDSNPLPAGRRGFLRSACRHCLGFGAFAGLPALAQDLSSIKVPPRFSRPAADTDEGGLWGMMDREEARLRRSPVTIKDKGLQSYLSDLICRLTDGHCPDIRVHAVRVPQFNAMMAPNGMMLVWSGLMLRVENEAQLVAVLGHEMGHYLERHQVEQLRAAKDHAMLAQIVGLVGGIGGFVGKMGIMASMFAFSREHEMRADRMGMRLMQQAGYDGREAAFVWDNLLQELRVTGGKEVGERGDMFGTHPTTAGRRNELLRLAGDKGGTTADRHLPQGDCLHAPGLAAGRSQARAIRGEPDPVRPPAGARCAGRRGAVRPRRGLPRAGRGRRRRQGPGGPGPREPAGSRRRPRPSARWAWCTSNATTAAPRCRPSRAYLAQAPDAPDAALVRSYLTELKP
jgi:hypothetical protein